VPRTLVLHPGALGDVLLAIPALRALRASAGGDDLRLAAQPRVGALLAALGVVDRALDFDALPLHALFTPDAPGEALGRLLAGARIVSWFGGRDPEFTRRLRSLAAEVVVASTRPAPGLTVWQHLLASVAPFASAAPDGAAWREPIAPGHELVEAGRRALSDAGRDETRPLVVLHPGAGGAPKRWPSEGFARLAECLANTFGADVIVHEGPADGAAVASLRERLRVPAGALVDPPLGTLAGAMRHAALWVGNDCGVSHLAADVGAPTLSLFTTANLAWRPWASGARVRVVSVDALVPADLDAVLADATEMLGAPKPAGRVA
jgi:heptosyltransferase III